MSSLYTVYNNQQTWNYLEASLRACDSLKNFDSLLSIFLENGSSDIAYTDDYYNLKLTGRSSILNVCLWQKIAPLLRRVCAHPLRLVYSSNRDGYTLRSLLGCAKSAVPSLLLLKLEGSVVIAIYRNDPWVDRNDAYGSPETTIIRIENNSVEHWRGLLSQDRKFIYIRSTTEYLIIGGGGSTGMALYSNSDFSKVTSDASEVFGNRALLTPGFFSISCLELLSLEVCSVCLKCFKIIRGYLKASYMIIIMFVK